MRALDFWKTVTADRSDLIARFFAHLDREGVRCCLIGGHAVNAYTEPVVSLDLDIAVAANDLPRVEGLLAAAFRVERFAHSLNLTADDSDVRIQIHTDPRYAAFVEHASSRTVLGLALPVARIEDVLRGKVWAAQDPARPLSKRQKDFADIARLLEAFPHLRSEVPPDTSPDSCRRTPTRAQLIARAETHSCNRRVRPMRIFTGHAQHLPGLLRRL